MKDFATPASKPPILSEFASDPEMGGLVAQFVNELPSKIESIMDNWRAQNFPEVERAAHQLKGALAGHGFPLVGLAASRLEAGLRGRSAREIEREASRLGGELRALIDLCSRCRA